jgi:uracil-DNA glycosylase family 4
MTTVAEINREIITRAKHMGLSVDCGADGVVNTRVAFVGEHPGERERMLKMPLVGQSGQKLWDTLRPHGISRRQAYITNVAKRVPLGKQTSSSKEEKFSSGEVSMYSSILLWELAQLPSLDIVVVLGNLALQAVTGHSGITMYRGSVFDVQLPNPTGGSPRTVKVVAMNNPAAILRDPKLEVMFKFDCARLKQVLDGTFVEHHITAHINPTFQQAMDWIDKMEREAVEDGKPVASDIETSSQETICIGLANDPHEGMCINFRTRDGLNFTLDQEVRLWRRLQAFYTNPAIRFVGQNWMYDGSWLWFIDRLRVQPLWFDTMLAHHTLYPILPHNLGALTTQYTTHPFYKDEGKQWRDGGDIDSHWRYNVKDACITVACQQGLLRELEREGLADFFFNEVMPKQPELIDMTVHGVLVDRTLKDKIARELEKDVEELKAEFHRQVAICTGDPEYKPNPASPKQMQKLYFERLKLVGRGVSTDKENRKRMREHPRTRPECAKLLNIVDKWAEESKFASTYAEMTIDDDGRVRSEYKQMGVVKAPGRLSSATTGWFTGTNLQNQPGRAHQMFIADDGYGFSYFDLAQAEARVVAFRAPIPAWMEQFERARLEGGYDCHRALCSQMFNIPYEDTPTEDWDEDGKPTKRYISKRCRHGLNYRMMPDRLATTLGVSYAEAEYLWHLYHKITPELQEWWEHTVQQVLRDKKMYNAYGRVWRLMERFSDEATESIVAFYPQSTIGDKVTRVIVQCHNDPEWPRRQARIALNNHDALIALHTLDVGAEVRGIMKKYAEEPILIEGYDKQVRELIVPADLKASVPDEHGVHRWSTLQKVKEYA